ncbi:hypothetical protein RHGRI_001650 [Rhododendron griersonianum]|uniref:Uncharacterized protein n=1 Tax=Rhododendron griersonianum TaxID=479676 RepID=A0AAV6LKX4_9ERIC|nr:hypothetical protein RHGRI_001650 [Rhododendron griersonianum]
MKRTHELGALGLLREDEMDPSSSGVISVTTTECPEVGLAALRWTLELSNLLWKSVHGVD